MLCPNKHNPSSTMGKPASTIGDSKWSITNITTNKQKQRKRKEGDFERNEKKKTDVKSPETSWRRQRKPSVQRWLVGPREWSLKWLERWLAKQGITDCRSWIWRAAFGLSKRWALHNPIFLPKHWDTQSLERLRWKHCVCVCVPLHRCWCLALVRPRGKFRNYRGWTMYKVVCVCDGDNDTDNVHKSWSALSLWSCGVLTIASLQSTHACTHEKHPHTHMHTSVFPCFAVRGLNGPSKRGREIGQGPAGSLPSSLEHQGRLKLPGPLSLPCYPPSPSYVLY